MTVPHTFLLRILPTVLTLLAAMVGVLDAAEPQTVIVFGDSITAGGALSANERDAMWVRVVERESEGRLRMVNEG